MKCLFTLTIVCVLAGAQALAQTGSNKNQAASSGDKSLPEIPSRVTRANMLDVQLKVQKLWVVFGKDPDCRECRLKLAQGMEGLGLFAEGNRDYVNAWRYYEGAAVAANYPREKTWKKRADQDSQNAARCHKLRLDYIKDLKLIGWVYTSFNWHNYKGLDPKAATTYMTEVGLPIRRNWSYARRTMGFRLPEGPEGPEGPDGPVLVVSFNVHRNGTVSNIKLVKSCGTPKLDAVAMRAIAEVGKMPELLPGMGEVVSFQSQFVK
jgi:TonB family protein